MNKRYIDANELKQRIPDTWINSFQNCHYCRLLSADEVLDVVNDMPTEDVQTVKHGRWTEKGECSVCHEVGLFYSMSDEVSKSDFCPWCGARMDGEAPPVVEEEKEGKQ